MPYLLRLTDAVAALLLAADLLVVCGSVIARSWFSAPVEWADDVARGLMVGSSFFGAASAIARAENPGVSFFVDMLPAGTRTVLDSMGALLVAIVSAYVAWTALTMGYLTTGQTTGSGLPLEWTFYPMGAGAACMTLFALDIFRRRPVRELAVGIAATAAIALLYVAWDRVSPDTVPSSMSLMLLGFVVVLVGGL
ncbi:MAG: TRAP transporter small permease, partial [Proteobacteria bacterium]|nr:TRAP transporter small permease [Pseudomonadota bacterium]